MRLEVGCGNQCEGPLQMLGLAAGDYLDANHVVLFAAQPEWRITRNGIPTRIILNLKP